jgi:hypothetical protein
MSNGNLDSATNAKTNYGTIAYPDTGKWYWECTFGGNAVNVGLAAYRTNAAQVYLITDSCLYSAAGVKNVDGVTDVPFGSTAGSGDIIGIAANADTSTLEFFKNGVSMGTISHGVGGRFPVIGDGNVSQTATANFGQRAFAYTAPSGFKALCTANLPAPLVTKPSTVFDAKLYTGNGSTQTISGLGFSPDFVWLKNRSSGSYGHRLVDSVRGSTLYLMSHSTGAEATDTNGVTAFNSDGFNLGNSGDFNVSSNAFVAWAWDAGSSTVTNTAGSITSSVRANTTAGFSIVTYTGTGANATVGHGLGVAPSFVIVKSRSNTTDWQGYHIALGQNYTIQLQSTSAAINVSNYWNGGVSSTTFGINGSYDGINFSGYTYVAYCFAPVVGYSSFGSYTGNGSTDGPFVYTGFRPRWVLIKRSDSTSNWSLFDTARDTSNVSGFPLFPNDPASEVDIRSNTPLDILSNGFKLRTSTLTGGTNINISSATYIYAAFAESPFNYARAR